MFKIAVVGSFAVVATISTCMAGLTWEQRQVELRPELGDKEATVEFPFANGGDGAVKVTSVKTSCGCTTATMDKTAYAKGESGAIHAKVKLGSWQGTKQKKITITTDDPAESTIILTLTVHAPATQPTTRPVAASSQPTDNSSTNSHVP